MHNKLRNAFETIERQRATLLDELRQLPNNALTTSPPRKWSILHILSHLITGERTGLEYVKKKMLGVDTVGNAGVTEQFKMVILILSQRLPFLKYRAPRIIVERTVVFDTLQGVEAEWDQLRGEWKVFLDSVPDQYVNRKIFRHVVAGRLNLDQGLRFFGEHVRHHKPQINTLISRSRRPK